MEGIKKSNGQILISHSSEDGTEMSRKVIDNFVKAFIGFKKPLIAVCNGPGWTTFLPKINVILSDWDSCDHVDFM